MYHRRRASTFPAGIMATSSTRQKLHVCGGISVHGPTAFQVYITWVLIKKMCVSNVSWFKTFRNNMNSDNYCEIIFKVFIPFLESCPFVAFEDFFLYQDNSPIHTSKQCKDFIESLNILWVIFLILEWKFLTLIRSYS